MPKATHDTITPTRRRVLGYGAFAAICDVLPLAVAEATQPGENPDLELIGLCEQIVTNQAAEYDLYQNHSFDIYDDPILGPQIKELHRQWSTTMSRVAEMAPVTLEGTRAMARAVVASAGRDSKQVALIDDPLVEVVLGWLVDDPELGRPVPRSVA
jgi:hypothetical protein